MNLGSPPLAGGLVNDINNHGHIVGFSSQGTDQAWLYTNQSGFQNLNNLIPAGSGYSLRDAVAINDAGAVPPDTGQIRIGVFAFASGGGAVGYAPPPNGGTGSGDILFDANSFYAFNSGGEGDPFDAGSTAPNDFETLLLHELGHAIGMAHPPHTPGGDCPVMDVDGECYGKINRELDADDIAGIQFLYGEATVVPLPTSVWLFGSALIGVLGLARRREA